MKTAYTQTKRRDSNMELFRIVAMILVMVVHSSFLAIGVPSHIEAITSLSSTISRFFVESLSVVCVNSFILLSGWYGINVNKNKILSLLFQILFFSTLIYCGFLLHNFDKYDNVDSFSTIFMFHSSDYWFIKSYIGLFLFAPIINVFINDVSEKQLRIFLISFYLFQTIYGWLSINGADWLGGGYSAVSFMGLYILARYVRIYNPFKITQLRSRSCFIAFFSIALLLTLLSSVVTYIGLPVAGRLFTYTNPLVIVESVFLLLAFYKLKIQSSIINWISSSCLAVYLVHANELFLRPYYGEIINNWYRNEDASRFFIYTITFILVLFFLSILVDKIRMFIWKMINRAI